VKFFPLSTAIFFAALSVAEAQSRYEPYSFTTSNAAGARMRSARGLTLDTAGNIYVANTNDHTILKITAGVATVFAGQSGVHGFADGTGVAAQFFSPSGVVLDNTGSLFVADTDNNIIRKITSAGVVTTFAGSPGPSGSADGAGPAARFSGPRAVAIDSAGNIYVADTNNHTIRRITPGGVVSTLAGFAGMPGSVDGLGETARFRSPTGVAVDGSGNIYVADSENNTIRKITPSGAVSTLAGFPGEIGSDDGVGCAARFNTPRGVAVDSGGAVFVTDMGNSTIRKITPSGLVTTLAGKAGVAGNADGTGIDARFIVPEGPALDNAGKVYVLDGSAIPPGDSFIHVGIPVPQPVPMVRTVMNTNDSGPGSLRQALIEANNGDTINFSADLAGQVITLTSGELSISDDVTINGPGANLLAVRRGDAVGISAFRIFHISPSRNVTISGLTISNGNAHGSPTDAGGGIYSDQANLTVDRCSLTGNIAEKGGAICNDGGSFPIGILTLTNSTLSGNSATAGGALYNGGLPDGTFESKGSLATIANCTFSGNSASDRGGGMNNSIMGFNEATIVNCTFNDNTAPRGSALETSGAACTVGNSIFKTGGSGPSITKNGTNPVLRDLGYNLLSDNPDVGTSGTTKRNTDPRLGPLQDNGGPTFTHAPLADSPAIDMGKNLASDACHNPVVTDQRGSARPVRFNPAIPLPTGGDGSDVGAVELSGLAPAVGNISTRLGVGTGENVLIGGFIIEGATPKRVLIRARAPSLSGVLPNTLPNPRLELHDATSTIANNNDWQTTQIGGVIAADQRQEIENSGLAPGNSAEAAIIATLPAGNYTAIVQDVSGASGIGIVEVFDLAPNVFSRLANISTRGFVQAGDNVMIGGIIVVNQPTKVIIRARGPALATAVSNPLLNPKLELHNQSSAIATNDDWQTTQIGGVITADQRQEIQDSGFAPGDPRESAIIATLQPGAYTAIVQDAGGGSGIGLVEVFVLP
jgi:hypothetical protein